MKITNPTTTNNKSPQCPICKCGLNKDVPNSSLLCSICNRRYYNSSNDFDGKQSEAFDEYDDLKTASSISSNGPLLLSSSNEFDSDLKLRPIGVEGESPYDKVIRSKYGNDARITSTTTTTNY